MNDLLSLISHHGYLFLAVLCFAEAVGFPLPAALAILTAGAVAAYGGLQTLLFAKFIPGINTMSPPLAGSMKMRLGDFLQFDALGAVLYVGAYSMAGYLFSDALRAITRGLRSAGFAAEIILGIGLAGYVGYRILIYRKYRLLDVIPRVQVEELARRVASDAAERLLIADVRSHGYYDADSERIAGSIRIEPNNLIEEVKNLPKDREIYLYCT